MKILGAGDNTADRYIDAGFLYPGGNALNVAVFAARAGVGSGYLGVLGNDKVGQHILRALEKEGVDTTLTRVADARNASADVELRGNDRVFLKSDRSTALFELDSGQLKAMRNYDVVHTGYAGSLFACIPEIAQRSRVSFDFGSRFEFHRHVDSLRHLFLASYSGSHLSGTEARELARRAVDAGAENVLVTRGARGALFANSVGIYEQVAKKVTVRDTLGAGDAFIAEVLVGLGFSRDVSQMLEAASAKAGEVCQMDGAFGYAMRFDPSTGAAGPDVHDDEKKVTA